MLAASARTVSGCRSSSTICSRSRPRAASRCAPGRSASTSLSAQVIEETRSENRPSQHRISDGRARYRRRRPGAPQAGARQLAAQRRQVLSEEAIPPSCRSAAAARTPLSNLKTYYVKDNGVGLRHEVLRSAVRRVQAPPQGRRVSRYGRRARDRAADHSPPRGNESRPKQVRRRRHLLFHACGARPATAP